MLLHLLHCNPVFVGDLELIVRYLLRAAGDLFPLVHRFIFCFLYPVYIVYLVVDLDVCHDLLPLNISELTFFFLVRHDLR